MLDSDSRQTRTPLASVVIPAHNEAKRIRVTLETLLSTAAPREFDVLVVCNGCSDNTAEEAKAVPGVRVVEIPEASKVMALREGDLRTSVFPRIYLDGDVRLSTAGARALVGELSRPGILASGIAGRYDLRESPLTLSLFYEFRQRMPVFKQGIIGAGVYALSRDGRRRFETWPDVLSDDGFINRLFARDAYVTVSSYHTLVRPPLTIRGVIRRGVRVRRANRQLSSKAESLALGDPPSTGIPQAIWASLRSPRGIASLLVFVFITAAIRFSDRLGSDGDWGTV